MLSYRDGKWQHHYQAPRGAGAAATGDTMFMLPPGHRPEPVEKYLAIGESRDGRIWSGRNVLSFFDGTKWEELFTSGEVRFGIIECMYTSREGDLWIGTRQNGALRFDGREWKQFQGPESMVANTVRSVVQGSDNTLWFATDRGTSRFDGITWMEDVLPGELTLQNEAGELKASSGGKVWINRRPPEWNRRGWAKSPPLSPDGTFSTTCHECGGPAPDTHIVAGMDTVSQPGNLSVLWRGAVPWCDPRDARLQYSWSLDEGPWSPFSPQHSQAFFSLPSGPHRLQVRARDQDFTVAPTPATMSFVVLPPVWRQPWFIALITILVGGVLAQTVRVLIKQGHLKRAHAELEDRVRQRTAELEATNRELEAFSYSVSHDLRAPLRRIEGFSQVLLEEHAAALNEEGKYFLNRVCNSAHQMGGLIEALLKMARITRGQMQLVTVDLSQMAHEIADELLQRDPSRKVVFSISPGLKAQADQLLIRAALMNLLENAWKYTSKCAEARIEVGRDSSTEHHEFFVRDNGVGFDPKNAGRLFGAFQRLHKAEEFPGTGVGLATVQRIIHRNGGTIRAEATPGKGAVFLFTLGATHGNHPGPHADRTGA
jgi:signal transduction histidine kinase